jgi:amino acid transporter
LTILDNNKNTNIDKKPQLSRQLGVWLLLFYGLGNILGAGIYVLIGKVASIAGYLSVASFALACIISVFTALSYIELASRYPVSAGEAVYVQEGFGSKVLSITTGILISLAGLVSAATLTHGFIGYLQEFVQISDTLAVILVVVLLIVIAIQGIKTSVTAAALMTLVEIFGLFLIIYLGFDNIINPSVDYMKFIPNASGVDFNIIFIGGFLAFYAFIGFEDMVNVAQEVKDPSKTFPKAIIWALVISTILYILISMVALQTLPLDELSNSKAPFADMYVKLTNNDPILISVIGLFAVINGALIQIIMASRVVYGMAEKRWLPSALAQISSKTNTPVVATVVVGGITLIFTLFFDLMTLASLTSGLILVIFTIVNIALIVIKRKVGDIEGIYTIPVWIPWLGVILNIMLIAVKVY